MRFQAGVFRWAAAQSWLDTADASPGDPKPRQEAIAALDDAIERFRSVGGGGDNPALGDNLRFRLAEALADRARLEPAGSAGRQSRESEALDLLENPPGEPGLAGYWYLLKADLLRRSGKLDEAAKQLEAAVKSAPPPSDGELVEVKVPLLLEQKKFAEAIAFLKSSHLEAPAKALWMVRARLAQLAGLAAGPERIALETDLFRAVGELRKGSSPETRQALLELAQSRLIPDAGHPPDVWDALAAAYAAAGDPATAGAQMTLAANRALALGKPDEAKTYRLRAGGFLFQAGKFAEADALLSAGRRQSRPHAPSRQGRHAQGPGAWPVAGAGLARFLDCQVHRRTRAPDPRFPRRSLDRRGPLAARRDGRRRPGPRTGPATVVRHRHSFPALARISAGHPQARSRSARAERN